MAGGVLGALGGAATGGYVGHKAGEAIDESRALYKCNKCGKEFNG